MFESNRPAFLKFMKIHFTFLLMEEQIFAGSAKYLLIVKNMDCTFCGLEIRPIKRIH